MSKKLFSKIFGLLLVVGLLFAAAPTRQAEASTYFTWVAQVPTAPTSVDTVRIWINSDTSEYETILVEYKIGETSTKVEGIRDDSFSGANWYADIPAQPAGTLVSYRFIVHHDTGGDYQWSGFDWSYTVAEATVMPVHNTTQGTSFSTIQAAVTAADEGDTIQVAAGTYDEENIVISKGINLLGAGAATTSIAPTTVTNNSTLVVRDPSGNVTISGFNFVMQPKLNYGSAVVVTGTGIAVDSATVTISNNVVTGSGDGSKADYGFYGQGSNAKVIIEYNVIGNTGDNPIVFEKQAGSTTVRNNEIHIVASPDYDPYYSMAYAGLTVSTPQIVEGNTFYLDHAGTGYASAITFNTAVLNDWAGTATDSGHYTNILIKDNLIYTNGSDARGINLADRSAGGSLGTITGAVITGNQIIGENLTDVNTYGIALKGDVQGTLIQSNIINNVDLGIRIIPGNGITPICPSGSTITSNQITSVGTSVKNECTSGSVDVANNWWGSAYGPAAGSIEGSITYTPWCADAACETFAPDAGGNVELSGTINVPGGILLGTPGLTYHLAADTVIQNDSPCFVIEASNTRILAEPGAKCIPTGESNGIDVAADLNNITIDGLEIDGSVQTTGTADGIHFAGAVSDFVLADNKIHNMLGDGIEFVGTPTGVMDIQGNLFQNNAGLGINAGTFEVLAQYNSWGSFTGPVVDTDITSAVNAIPFTHADVTLSPIYGTTDRVVTSLANVSGRPTVLKDGTLYHLWYGPTDITLYHSVSTNPAEFPVGQVVTFSTTPLEVSSTAIFKEGETFYMVAYDGTNNQAFALYNSTDGTAWTYQKQIFNATGMTDLGKIDAPFVFNDGGTFKLYFQKKSFDGLRYDIYLATSTTVDGTYALANSGNPVLSLTEGAWDGKFVMHPWVVKDVDTYYMWYSAYDTGIPQEIGLATSTDGIIWTKSAANPVIGPTGEPTVIKDGDTWRIWYLSGATIKYQTALSPLDLRQTLAYQVTANLVNVNAADVTITYPTDLLTIAELTSGTDIPGTFDTSVAGQISFRGYTEAIDVTKENAVLFNAIFLNKSLGSGDIAFGLAEFGMAGAPDLSSNNVYLVAETDTAEVEIKELPFLATDLDSAYYLTGEPQTFTVTITNYGTTYSGAVLNLSLPTGVTVEGLTNPIDLAANAIVPLTLTFTSTTPGEKTIGFDLKDSLGALLFSTVETATVYDKPTVTIAGDQYYIVNEPGAFTVTINNPVTGKNHDNTVVFDIVIADHLPEDISALSCSMSGYTWDLLSSLEAVDGEVVARIEGADGFFTVPPTGVDMVVSCSVTYATAGTYVTSGEMVDVLDTVTSQERVVSTNISATATVYTAPDISATFPTGPYVAGESVIVPISITNPDDIPGPFELVLDLPDGTVFTFNGVDYLCGDDPETTEVEEGCPAIPVTLPLATSDLVITFDEGWTGSIGFSLYDTSWEPDRLLATFTEEGVTVLGAFDVSGTVSMQGRSAREGVKLILTGTPGTYYAFSSTLISDNYVIEDVAEGIYTFTTYQPRYLNITADLGKSVELTGSVTLNSLWLRGGNAMWYDMVEGVQVLTNLIDLNDAAMVTDHWGVTVDTDADVNFDMKVNIQDLALVGGNMDLTSAAAYGTWVPLP